MYRRSRLNARKSKILTVLAERLREVETRYVPAPERSTSLDIA